MSKKSKAAQQATDEPALKPEHFQRFTKLNYFSPLGQSLWLELDAQIKAGTITQTQANVVLQTFNEVYYQQLSVLEQQPSKIEAKLDANLDLYRFFDDQADLEISDAEITYQKPLGMERKRYADKLFIQALDTDKITERAPVVHIDADALEKQAQYRSGAR